MKLYEEIDRAVREDVAAGVMQEVIDRMVCDVVRIRCSKILLSPKVWDACADRIAERSVEDGGTLFNINKLIVRGVPAERCTSLTGTEYALVPMVRTISSPWGLDAE